DIQRRRFIAGLYQMNDGQARKSHYSAGRFAKALCSFLRPGPPAWEHMIEKAVVLLSAVYCKPRTKICPSSGRTSRIAERSNLPLKRWPGITRVITHCSALAILHGSAGR